MTREALRLAAAKRARLGQDGSRGLHTARAAASLQRVRIDRHRLDTLITQQILHQIKVLAIF